MTLGRRIYRVVRSVLFTAIVAAGALYLLLYLLLSIPPVQNKIKEIAVKEITAFLGGEVEIESLDILPFNEVRLKGIRFISPEGDECLKVGTLAAGIRVYRLITEGKIELTYGEILDLDGKVVQKEKDGPLNIDYIIEALAPKDKNKPPTKIDLVIHNIVIRRSALSFDRLWIPVRGDGQFDANHIKLRDLSADVTLPQLKNNDFIIDLRRLAFKAGDDFEVEKLSLKTHISPTSLTLSDFQLNVGEGKIKLGNLKISYLSPDKIKAALEKDQLRVDLQAVNIMPSEYSFFYLPLKNIKGRFDCVVEATGNLNHINVSKLNLSQLATAHLISLQGEVDHLSNKNELTVNLSHLDINLPQSFIKNCSELIPNAEKREKIGRYLANSGDFSAEIRGKYSNGNKEGKAEGRIKSGYGAIMFDVSGTIPDNNNLAVKFDLDVENLDLGAILSKNVLGETSFTASGDISKRGKDFNGTGEVLIDYIDFKGMHLTEISLRGEKKGNQASANVDIENQFINLNIDAEAYLAGENSTYKAEGNILSFTPSMFGIYTKYPDYQLTGSFSADIAGNTPDNMTGEVIINHPSFTGHAGEGYALNEIKLTAQRYQLPVEDEDLSSTITNRRINLTTDFLSATVDGNYKIKELIAGVRTLLHDEVSSFVPAPKSHTGERGNADFKVRLQAGYNYAGRLKLPIAPLQDVDLSGSVDLEKGIISVNLDAPYILQGGKKLISGSRVNINVERGKGALAEVTTIFPIKNDRANFALKLNALRDHYSADLGWTMVNNKQAEGLVSMEGSIERDPLTGNPLCHLTILPSSFHLGPSDWSIERSDIYYADKRVNVESLRIWHEDQFVEIGGTASANPEDELNVRLAEIDLSYIFELLNINYVTFGGIATGEVSGSSLFTKTPIAQTKRLFVKDFAYNEAVLGDADIYSVWNNQEKEIEIHADIEDEYRCGAKVDGGIYVTRDSLSFDMEAKKVNIEFLKPFMEAFTSDVGGRASGKVKLFGTFKDIDLTGRVFADSIFMKVDYTNVYYHGSDSVYLNPNQIEIPAFSLYDKYGHSAVLTGFVKHRYFHDPVFEFKISKADNLLCYDTNSSINPDWYGTIYASGSGILRGHPGLVGIEMDMTTNDNSDFTFVLNDTQTALDYTFLTFSDKKKEEKLAEIEVEETFEEKFFRHQEEEEGGSSIFAMDLRVTATPGARMNLIMDPNAGDKITARGGGPLQIHYDTKSDEMTMYGKYTLAEGNYNFSLQELILRDFKINPGSSISFNGDPLAAILDIEAAYRVNTNLSDLDKSFANDRDLNRTNVPVDALLKVRGEMTSPEITFDLALPTLTGDVERKVKSIISTEDMMNRQIIYLLALNRFYTPEYMGSSSNGGEFASVASSTISSQLSNIMGQLSDKFTVAPSFRSDKGDFSDMEVDVALSSRLLNNRLLLNGNFGYRDKSTSQTTFVGDFDLEYLLSRNGNLRLKAYNHFNDQNYYLKSSLTTQGIGIIYRKEFDNPFSWLRRKKKDNRKKGTEEENGEVIERDTLINDRKTAKIETTNAE